MEFRVAFSADFVDDEGQLIFPDIGLGVLEDVPSVQHEFLTTYHPEYIPEQLRDYDVLISLKPRVTAQSLEDVHRLSAIGRCGVGYDNVDLAACTAHDVAVYITPAGVVRPVAEAIVLFVLALSHHLVSTDRMVRRGDWKLSTRHLGREPRGRTIGTVGLGNIASEALRLLRPFGVRRFLAFDPYLPEARAAALDAELVGLDDLLRESDYVLINCPLTSQTRHLIGSRELSLMKPDAFLINTARGAVVDERALVQALKDGKIRGAGLDVFEQEPIGPDSELLQMENVILTSHSVAWTEELFRDMGRIDCEGALAIRRGEVPGSVVNTEVLSRPGFLRKLERYASEAVAYRR
jgi:phosphoglycerate dehydrogenase-like enzyme